MFYEMPEYVSFLHGENIDVTSVERITLSSVVRQDLSVDVTSALIGVMSLEIVVLFIPFTLVTSAGMVGVIPLRGVVD